MKNYLLYMLAAVTAVSASCSKNDNEKETSSAMPVDVALPVIDSVVIRKSYPGYLKADNALDIVARINGYITSKQYTNGQTVKKGQVLFTIEDSQYRDAVKQAEAALETAIATNKYATNRYQAMKKAFESDAVSQIDVIQAESAMNESVASIENCRAALQTAKTTLSYCTIRATCDGHISSPKYSTGDYVGGAGSPVVLTTIYDDSFCRAQFSIDETQYIKMKNDNSKNKVDYSRIPVSFTDSLPHTYTGELTYIAPDVDTSTGTVTLDVKITNPYGELKQGMYVLVNLPSDTNPSALLIKDSAIATDQLGKYIYVVNDSNRIVYTPIKTGELVNDTMRIVTEGLTAENRYVTKALLKVKSGMEVNPIMTK